MMMSQGMTMFTPDYQTPAEAQFACNMDPNVAPDKEPRASDPPAPLPAAQQATPILPRSPPCPRTPSSDPSPWARSPRRDGTRAARPVAGPRGPGGSRREQRRRRRGHLPHPGTSQTPGRSRLAPHNLPPCLRNPFLGDEEQPAEVPAHRRSGNSATPAALATMSRLRADFVDLGVVGRGGFCRVFKCISRLDGAMYAVKRTERKLQSEREKQEALREVQAMAGLGGGLGCEHIVRYFGAWMEYDHLLRPARTLRRHPRRSVHRVHAKSRARPRARRAKRGADSQSNASMPDALDDPEDADAFVFGEREILVVMRRRAGALRCARARRRASRRQTRQHSHPPRNVQTRRLGPRRACGRRGERDPRGTWTRVCERRGGRRGTSPPELLRGEFHAGGASRRFAAARAARDSPGPSAGPGPGPGPSAMAMDSPGMPRAGPSGWIGPDALSLGATSCELARGARGFQPPGRSPVLRRGRLDTLPPGFSPGFRALLVNDCAQDPSARPTARGVLVELNEREAARGTAHRRGRARAE